METKSCIMSRLNLPKSACMMTNHIADILVVTCNSSSFVVSGSITSFMKKDRTVHGWDGIVGFQ